MAPEFAYPVTLTPDETDGGFVVTFGDIPEAITQGESVSEALAEAADALEEAIAGRIRRGDPIPDPSPVADRYQVPVPAQTAAKAALYLAVKEAGIGNSQGPGKSTGPKGGLTHKTVYLFDDRFGAKPPKSGTRNRR